MQNKNIFFAASRPNDVSGQPEASLCVFDSTELMPADIGFIFGNSVIADLLAETAADYYHAGYFPYIVVTGAPQVEGSDLSESDYIVQRLLERGVPADRLIIENRSTNTQENIEFARPLIDEKFGKDQIQTLVGFGHVIAGTRFLMTLKRRWPEVMAMHVSVNPYPVPAEQWHACEPFRRAVQDQAGRITPYLERDWISPVDLPSLNAQISGQKRVMTRQYG